MIVANDETVDADLIAANLPYNVGTALFTGWLSGETWPPQWASLTLMFQQEVAERLGCSVRAVARGTVQMVLALPGAADIRGYGHRRECGVLPDLSRHSCL